MSIDLSVPIWTIEHVAAALGNLSVDAARYAYTAAFPTARDGFARNLWLREEVLAWFAGLPGKRRRSAEGGDDQQPQGRTSATGTAGKTSQAVVETGASAPTAPDGTRRTKPYRPRSAA